MTISLVGISFLDGSHKSPEFSGDDPVEVTVFNPFVEFVFLDIEGFEIVPPDFDRELDALQTLEQGAVVQAVSLAGVSVVLEHMVVVSEFGVSIFGRHFKNDDAETPHQEGGIHHLVGLLARAVVEDSALTVVLVLEQPSQFSRKPVDHCQVKWAEVLVEGKIRQVLVDVEKEGVLVVLRRLDIADPVQLILDDFYRRPQDS